MAVTCPIDFDVASLRVEVQTMYSRVATSPNGEFHFHRGPQYAATMLGYDSTELAVLPPDVTSSFAGVGNPHAIGRVPAGATVADIGCGAGTDLLLAARRAGPRGRAIGVDMTEAMRQRATAGASACGLDNVEVRNGDATRLPIDDRSVDVVISNGVLNLVPEKERAVAEIARVLKPGGRVQIADIIIGEVLPDSALRDIDLWTG
ncbi:MAG: methyltransferase type 11 [Acidobacteria bacterium 13_2_20CM_2_66_4]|nr:MAG: methyltransferase type 11 [Acidobacteria bacterium 13_2_20CM_2_66_4]